MRLNVLEAIAKIAKEQEIIVSGENKNIINTLNYDQDKSEINNEI